MDVVQNSGGLSNKRPKELNWIDDMKKWPAISEVDIWTYLVERKACDLREMKAYKSTAAYNYFLSECVGKVLVAISGTNEDDRYLKAQVRPSQSVNQTYDACVMCKKDGSIQTGGCVCKAGESAVCSHLASILYKIQYANAKGLCGENCTDRQQMWNSGTSKNVIPSEVCQTNFKRPKATTNFDDFRNISSVSVPSSSKKLKTTAELFSLVENSVINTILNAPGSLFNSTLVAESHAEVQNKQNVIIWKNISQQHTDIHNEALVCIPCLDVYSSIIVGNQNIYEQVVDLTVDQSSSTSQDLINIWKICRKVRITCSTAPNIPKKTNTKPDTFLRNHLFGKFYGTKDTMRGSFAENLARKKYEETYQVSIRKSGIRICKSDPWLAGSPDGLIGDHSIVEIKSPNPDKFDSYLKRKSYEILINETGEFNLNKTKSYYQQVQLCMHCHERSNCVFIVYLGPSRDPIIFNVKYDNEYVQQKLNFCRKFYFQYFLPYIVESIKNNSLIIPYTYFNLFRNKR